MLLLRPEQLEVMERHLLQALRKRLERAIAATFPELNVQSAAQHGAGERTREIVNRGIDMAAELGIEEAPDMAAYIALGLALRMVPPETPTEWIRSWLDRPDTSGATKLAVIEAQLADSAAADPALALIAERVARARQEAGL
jgi:hypothetical protein